MGVMHTIKRGVLAAGIVLSAANGAVAGEDVDIMDLPKSELGKYAAFAKLESNLAEVTAGTLVQKVMKVGDAKAAMDVDDPTDDIAAAEAYVGKLEAMDLTDAESAALTAIKAGWGELMAMREKIVGVDTPSADDLVAYWKKANAVDEMIDDVLQGILASSPVTN